MTSNTVKAAEVVTTERFHYLAEIQKKVLCCNQHPDSEGRPHHVLTLSITNIKDAF